MEKKSCPHHQGAQGVGERGTSARQVDVGVGKGKEGAEEREPVVPGRVCVSSSGA